MRFESMLITILIIFLILALLGTLPQWPYSRSWGRFPASAVGIILIIVMVLWALGRLPAM